MFTPIKNILISNVKNSGFSRQVDAAQAIEFFNEVIVEIFGSNVKEKSKALYFKNQSLAIACLSSVFIQEMYLRRSKIIREINKKLGGEVVKSLKFRI